MKSSQTAVAGADSKYGEQLSFDPQFRGPIKSRSCTDIICLFLFVSFIAGWLVVGFFAFREGDPRVLLYPTDSAGNICGVKGMKDKPYLFFFDLMKCATPRVLITGCLTPQVCVEQCPNTTFFANENLPNHEEIKAKLICKYDIDKEKQDLKTLLNEGHCAKLYLKSRPLNSAHLTNSVPYGSRIKDVLFGRCIPEIFRKDENKTEYVKDERNRTIKVDDDELTVASVKNATRSLAKYLSVGEFGEQIFSDFRTSWKYLLAGLLFSMLISLVWIVLMRWLAGPMVWLSIIAILAFSAFACYYSTTKYIALKNVKSSEAKFRLTLDFKSYLQMRKTWLAFAIISGVVFGILFLVIIFLRKRIYIAVALIKEGSRAVGSMPSSLIFPLVPYLMMLVFFLFWVVVALYISSSGKANFVIADAPSGSNHTNGTTCNPKDHNVTGEGIKCLFRTYGMRDNIYTSHFYNLYGLFWGLFFSVGVGQISLAGAFATYYWTRDKSKDLPLFAVATGFYRCLRFHLGSVAFGSLLIATVRMIRVMLEYVDKKCKKYDNAFTRAILCCMKCCLWCLENLLKFISKNAYIMIAIYGKNFCASARKAFFLLMRNILRVIVLDKLTDFLLLLGKLVVVAISGGIAFYFFATDQEVYKGIPTLNYNLVPPIVITIGAYLIASGFFSVYGMAVDTLFLCFLEDCERNDGSAEKPYFMSKELMKLLHKKNKYRELSPPRSPNL